jgi:hypothetical protein
MEDREIGGGKAMIEVFDDRLELPSEARNAGPAVRFYDVLAQSSRR